MTKAAAKILIVEDDKNTAKLVATYLQKEGFSVLVENDGKKGLQTATEKQPNLVILDLMLPNIERV